MNVNQNQYATGRLQQILRRNESVRQIYPLSGYSSFETPVTEDIDETRTHRECEYCGESVPAAIYREHLLKACPGE